MHEVFPRHLLLDRDGTLIEDRHYLADPEGVCLLPGVGEALARFARHGTRLYMVSNQSGLARGYFDEAALRACQARLDLLLAAFGVSLADAVWCPHAPEEACLCRKPGPGLWERLARKHNLLPEQCWMVGDKRVDVDFATRNGLALGVLVLTGKGELEARRGNLIRAAAPQLPALEHAVGPQKLVVRDLSELADLAGLGCIDN